MRATVIVALAGCFNPRLTGHLACAQPDHWCPPPQKCGADGICDSDAGPDAGLPEGNLVFVTSEQFSPSMFGANDAILQAADDKCMMLGQALRPGSYKAWLGTSAAEAASRIAVNTGWARPDGKPVATSMADLLAGVLYYPPRIDEQQQDLVAKLDAVNVLTTLTSPPTPCSMVATISVGAPDGDDAAWNAADFRPCSESFYLYCFETDRIVPVVAPELDTALAYAFITEASYPIGNVLELDTHCQTEGAALQRTFLAFVAPTNAFAQSRFASATRPWTRLDGVIVAEPALDRLLAPITMTAAHQYRPYGPAFGAASAVENGLDTANCVNWTNTTGMSLKLGNSTRSSSAAFADHVVARCSDPITVYCLEAQ